MAGLMRRTHAIFDSYIGRCPNCMRKSLLSAVVAWAAFDYSLALNIAPLWQLLALLAVSLTGLWLAHLTTFAARRAICEKKSAAVVHGGQSRRQVFSTFARTFGTLALVTALPGAASAQDRTNNCLTCCAKFLSDCGQSGACNVNYQNCVSNCNAQGSLPVQWQCW